MLQSDDTRVALLYCFVKVKRIKSCYQHPVLRIGIEHRIWYDCSFRPVSVLFT